MRACCRSESEPWPIWLWTSFRGIRISLLQRVDVIHDVPHVAVADARPAVQAVHRAPDADAIADVDEDLSVGGTVIPLIIGEIGWVCFARLRQLHWRFSHAIAGGTVTLRTVFGVEILAGSDGFRRWFHGILQILRLKASH